MTQLLLKCKILYSYYVNNYIVSQVSKRVDGCNQVSKAKH